ncbi:MAG TPA: UPF0280 family protein [Candidatus Methanofastidiosa archaeon]|nr:UPF0280 family protein [Candidatus Methanofastidiosa archaeon]HPR41113.1 UPF0280 family protein [Candidatus Methanofastidiosa archaeon]
MKKKDYPRDYRRQYNTDLFNYSVVVDESDLYIRSDKMLATKAYQCTKEYRDEIIRYIAKNPEFGKTLVPFTPDDHPTDIVMSMIQASFVAGVGPMASVAGAIAEYVGKELLKGCEEVIIENGGDIFLRIVKERTVGTFAGDSSFSNRVFFTIDPKTTPLGICTSSGTIGHSLSYGNADAVTVLSSSAILADALATSICNMIKCPQDIEMAIRSAKDIPGVIGVVALMGEDIGIWGNLKIKDRSGDGAIYFTASRKDKRERGGI